MQRVLSAGAVRDLVARLALGTPRPPRCPRARASLRGPRTVCAPRSTTRRCCCAAPVPRSCSSMRGRRGPTEPSPRRPPSCAPGARRAPLGGRRVGRVGRRRRRGRRRAPDRRAPPPPAARAAPALGAELFVINSEAAGRSPRARRAPSPSPPSTRSRRVPGLLLAQTAYDHADFHDESPAAASSTATTRATLGRYGCAGAPAVRSPDCCCPLGPGGPRPPADRGAREGPADEAPADGHPVRWGRCCRARRASAASFAAPSRPGGSTRGCRNAPTCIPPGCARWEHCGARRPARASGALWGTHAPRRRGACAHSGLTRGAVGARRADVADPVVIAWATGRLGLVPDARWGPSRRGCVLHQRVPASSTPAPSPWRRSCRCAACRDPRAPRRRCGPRPRRRPGARADGVGAVLRPRPGAAGAPGGVGRGVRE